MWFLHVCWNSWTPIFKLMSQTFGRLPKSPQNHPNGWLWSMVKKTCFWGSTIYIYLNPHVWRWVKTIVSIFGGINIPFFLTSYSRVPRGPEFWSRTVFWRFVCLRFKTFKEERLILKRLDVSAADDGFNDIHELLVDMPTNCEVNTPKNDI